MGHPMGASGAIQTLYMKVLMQRNFVAESHRDNANFIISVSEPLFVGLIRVTYAIHL